MNIQHFLKRFSSAFSILFIVAFALVPHMMTAQTKIAEISTSQAQSEVNEAASSFGFNQLYLSNSQIEAFRAVERSEGIRFYTALNTETQRPTLIAIAVTNDGTELGEYAIVKGLGSSNISKSAATAGVQASIDSDYTAMNARVSTSDLINLVVKDGANGIHVKPGNGGFILVAATENGSESADFGVAYNKLEEPCPPLCEDNTLIRMD
jgi:hypothetical protein